MIPAPRFLALRIAAFYAGVFGLVGVLIPFWPVWLDGRGLSATEVALLLGVITWVRMAADPLVGQFSDRRGERKRPLVVLCLATVIAYAVFPLAGSLATLALMSVIAGAAFAPVVPLGNTLALQADRHHGVVYGRVRLWGSAAFIAASLLGGWALSEIGTDAIIWLAVALAALSTLTATALPDWRPARPHLGGSAIIALLRQPLFALFLATVSFIQAAHAVYYAFATLHWRQVGYADTTIGLFWSIGVLAEIALFAVAGRRLARFSAGMWIIIGAVGGIVRWTVLGVSDAPWAVVPAQILHAATFGAMHLGSMYFISRRVPPQLAATAQSLNAALVTGGALGLAMWGAGPLFDRYGAGAYLAMSGLSAVGLGLAVWLEMRLRRVRAAEHGGD